MSNKCKQKRPKQTCATPIFVKSAFWGTFGSYLFLVSLGNYTYNYISSSYKCDIRICEILELPQENLIRIDEAYLEEVNSTHYDISHLKFTSQIGKIESRLKKLFEKTDDELRESIYKDLFIDILAALDDGIFEKYTYVATHYYGEDYRRQKELLNPEKLSLAFKGTFGKEFTPSTDILDLVYMRNDIMHHHGLDKEGFPHILSEEDIINAINTCQKYYDEVCNELKKLQDIKMDELITKITEKQTANEQD